MKTESSQKLVIGLGVAAILIAIAVLVGWGLKNIDKSASSDSKNTLALSTNAKPPLKLDIPMQMQQAETFTITDKGAAGIQVQGDAKTDFKVTLPNSLGEQITVALSNGRTIGITQKEAADFQKIMKDKITQTPENAKLLAIIQKDPSLAVYQDPDNNLAFYNFQKVQGEKTQSLFKNWILFNAPPTSPDKEAKPPRGGLASEGAITQAYALSSATVTLDANGNANVFYGETQAKNQDPAFIIPKPYFLDKDGNKTDLVWKFEQATKILSVTFIAKPAQYPIALDPSILKTNTVIATFSGKKISMHVPVPTVSAVSAGTPTATGATVTWTTDIASTSYVDYGTTVSYGTTVGDATLATSHSVTLSGLSASTTYYFRTRSTSAIGKETISSDASFVTATPPFICGTSTIAGAGSITYGSVFGADGKCWLDRNLGAPNVATAFDNSAGYGYYYQWGRGTDGHQITTSVTTSTLSSSDAPGHGSFILAPSAPNDWRSPQNNNLWQGVSGINNPCPTGFRIPTQSEWAALVSAAGITDYSTAWSSTLKLTAAGYRRNSGAWDFVGGAGFYWSSSPSDASASSLYFYSFGIAPAYAYNRASGFSVRCLKDVDPPACNAIIPGQTCSFGGKTYGVVTGADGKVWLDRNLGAPNVATAFNNSANYGYYYQWGRGTDGHQITTSGTTSTLSSSDAPGHGSFILAPSAPNDWRSTQNNNLWQGVSGINNPCPTGFRIPTQSEWAALVSAAGITNYSTAWSSTLKLTAAGFRGGSDGSLSYQGAYGNYWSSSVTGTYAFNLFFYSGGFSPDSHHRANGLSVRCVKD
jgi:uncharacterized protein (TIGR02145 family)